MKSIIRILLSFITFIFVILLICVCFLALNRNANILGYSIYIASGNSMNPVIQAGDILLISQVNTYHDQDIIVYKNDEGIVVCHRVLSTDGILFVTRGDNNNFTDGYNPTLDDVYGKVIFNIINTKTLDEYKYHALGVIIGIPILLAILRKVFHVRSDNN